MKAISLLTLLTFSILLSCTSGKKAFQRGDYYSAVIQSVERLRQRPDHEKSQSALKLAYPLAVEFLQSQATATIASDAPFKWKQVIGYYEEINRLSDEVRTSPAALRLVPKPVTMHAEIADLKKKAAEESYEAGIQSMMRNTRSDAIKAFYLFKEANEFEPGIKDVVELQYQAEYNATIRILYVKNILRNEWVMVEPVINSLRLPFTKFYNSEEATQEKAPIQHSMLIEILGYSEGNPSITKTENSYTDSVLVDKTIGGKKVKAYQLVTGKATLFQKDANSKGNFRVVIHERETNKQLFNTNFIGEGIWSDRWSRCSGDNRAIPERIRSICSKAEPKPNSQQMLEQARRKATDELRSSLSSFYRLQ